jgi:hypothetical protein
MQIYKILQREKTLIQQSVNEMKFFVWKELDSVDAVLLYFIL